MDSGAGTSDPIANEEQKMISLVEKVKRLEQELRERNILIDRLKDLINKCHSDCFPPEPMCEPTRKW